MYDHPFTTEAMNVWKWIERSSFLYESADTSTVKVNSDNLKATSAQIGNNITKVQLYVIKLVKIIISQREISKV